MAITRQRLLSSLRIASVFASAALLVSSLLFDAGCDDAYEPSCEVTSAAVLVRDPSISAGDALSLTRSFDKVIATWQRRDLSNDGGPDANGPDANGRPDANGPDVSGDAAADATDAADAGPDAEPPNEAPLVTAFEVASIDARTGALTSRTTIPAPFELRQRRSAVEDIGIVPEQDGNAFLIHWKEVNVRTDALGRLVQGASLKTVYVTNANGSTANVTSEVRTIAEATCDKCRVTLSFIPLQSETLLIARTDFLRTELVIAPPTEPVFVVLRLRRDGTTLVEPTPWLRLPLVQIDGGFVPLGPVELTGDAVGEPPGRPDLATSVDGEGRISITAGPRAWLADSSPRLLRGPILLPNAPDARLRWEGDQGEASIAWSVSPTRENRGRDPSKREIFTGLVPSGAAGFATRERASIGRTTIAFDRRGDDVGVIFESDQRDLFAWLDLAGKKHGADLFLRKQPGVGRGEFGFPLIPDRHLLFARGDGRFTTLTLGFSELTSKEIRCVAKK
jgi:hypothetical protein